jgi:uncharacterized membrane protein YhhN
VLASQRSGWRPGVRVAKPAAALCFLWAALVWGATSSEYGRWILLGLALSACGDVLLLAPGRGRGFQAGIGAFLLAHVAYALAFLGLALDALALGLAAPLVGLAAWRSLRWLAPFVPGELRAAVTAYVAVIATMVALACAASLGGGPALAAVGAIAFAASDLSVARDRFIAPGFANAAWGLPLYFAAQLALASTVAASAPEAQHLLLPVHAVEGPHLEGGQVHALEAADVDGHVVRVGAGDAERRDAAAAAEVVLRRTRAELVGLDRAPVAEQPEVGGRDAPVDVAGARADRAVAHHEALELSGHLVADRTAVAGAAIGRHTSPPVPQRSVPRSHPARATPD